jgi:hypothetical protein
MAARYVQSIPVVAEERIDRFRIPEAPGPSHPGSAEISDTRQPKDRADPFGSLRQAGPAAGGQAIEDLLLQGRVGRQRVHGDLLGTGGVPVSELAAPDLQVQTEPVYGDGGLS